jgi:tRNA-dihydrouridine synthase
MLGCAVEHLEVLMVNMGPRSGLRHARKHLSAYAEHAGASEPIRLRLVTTDAAREAISLLTEIFSRDPAMEIAAEAA